MRLFEAMKLGVAPVIISDKWILPKGPDWHKFSLIIRERDIPNLESIVTQNECRYEEMGKAAREAYLSFFSPEVYFDYVVDRCIEIHNNQIIPEKVFFKFVTLPIYNAGLFYIRIKSFLKRTLALPIVRRPNYD
jgi:hypothetical protein